MSGFKDNSLNISFETGFFEIITAQLIECSREMKAQCIKTGNHLSNDENKITARLVEGYLNKGASTVRFIYQAPENYLPAEDRYIGVTDIKVVSRSWFDDPTIYYTIECKRLDGGAHLNKEYVVSGIARFTSDAPKYPSHDKKNIMLGYVVKSIDVPNNMLSIERLQYEHLKNATAGKFVLTDNSGSEYYVYSCPYSSKANDIELKHVFYNFADVICG